MGEFLKAWWCLGTFIILVLDYVPEKANSKIFGLIMYPCVCSKKLNVHFGANKLGMAGMQDRFPNMIFTTFTVAFSIIDLV